MRRDLDTPKSSIKQLAPQGNGKIQSGLLAEDYDGVGMTAWVRLGRTASSSAVRARVSPFALGSNYPEGTAVSVRVIRGRAEILGFGLAVQSKVMCLVEKTGGVQTIATGLGTPDKVLFANADIKYDPFSCADAVNDRITIPFDGNYRITSYSKWDTAVGARRHHIYVNGSDRWMASTGSPANSAGTDISGTQAANFTITAPMSADDYLEVWASQNSGANLTCNSMGLTIELVS